MSDAWTCLRCGISLEAEDAGGLCLSCLLDAVLSDSNGPRKKPDRRFASTDSAGMRGTTPGDVPKQ